MKKVLMYIFISIILLFMASYMQARFSAERYIEIMTIRDEESYQRIKNRIYNISTEDVKEVVFGKEHYEGPNYQRIIYKVDKVKCQKILGFRQFIFQVNFTVRNWGSVESWVYIKDGIVYNTHRKE